MLTSFALGCKGGANLLARILGIPLVHDVAERDEVIIAILTIHIIIDGDQAYTFLTEHLHDFANLEVVTTDSAHILDADRVDVTGVDFAHHGHEARTIKACTGETIIGVVDEVGDAMIPSVVLQEAFLRRDLSRWFSAKGYQKSNGAATRHLYGSPSTI